VVEEQVATGKAVIKLNDNLDLIASPAVFRTGTDFRGSNFARYMDRIRIDCQAYDIVIFDTPSGMLDIIRLIACQSDMNLVILNPELTSIANNYGLLKLLVGLNKEVIFHIFVNMAESGKDSEYIYQKLSALMGRYLRNLPFFAGYLNVHQSIAESVARQKALSGIETEARITDQILTLCKFVTGKLFSETKEIQTVTDFDLNSKSIVVDIKE
jgi:MinD-like ATPase involved in chromosome partitioning or flagellar assembly